MTCATIMGLVIILIRTTLRMGTTSVNKTLSRVQILDKGNRLETYHEVEEKSNVLTFSTERDLAMLGSVGGTNSRAMAFCLGRPGLNPRSDFVFFSSELLSIYSH